jgi:hypothetical protein
MKRDHGRELRRLLRTNYTIQEICDFEDVQVFLGATNYTGVLLIQNSRATNEHEIQYKRRSLAARALSISQADLTDDVWTIRDRASAGVVARVQGAKVSMLSEIAAGVSEGIVTGKNDVFLVDRTDARKLQLEAELVRSCVRGRDIQRWWIESADSVVIYPYKSENGRTAALSERELTRHPHVWRYLNERRADLRGRSYFERSAKTWYELWCQRSLDLLAVPKILVPEVAANARFALATARQFYGDTVCGIVLRESIREHLKFILGLLNSHLLDWYYKRTTVPKANQYFIYKTMFLSKLPVRRIDFQDRRDVGRHDGMVELVDRMLALHSKLAATRTDHEKTVLQRQIVATDREIDALVYELYGLTDDEIKIVEEASHA